MQLKCSRMAHPHHHLLAAWEDSQSRLQQASARLRAAQRGVKEAVAYVRRASSVMTKLLKTQQGRADAQAAADARRKKKPNRCLSTGAPRCPTDGQAELVAARAERLALHGAFCAARRAERSARIAWERVKNK